MIVSKRSLRKGDKSVIVGVVVVVEVDQWGFCPSPCGSLFPRDHHEIPRAEAVGRKAVERDTGMLGQGLGSIRPVDKPLCPCLWASSLTFHMDGVLSPIDFLSSPPALLSVAHTLA